MTMKKFRIISLLFILTFSFSVKAEVFMEINCNDKSITGDNKVNCEGNLIYEGVSVSDISFEYQTNLDISFQSVEGFTQENSQNKVNIHAISPLYDEILDSKTIVQFTLSANDYLTSEEELRFLNIKINNNNQMNVSDVIEKFEVISSQKLDNTCTLDSISVDNTVISNFDKEILEYRDIVVNKDIVFIDAERTGLKSTATGLGDVFIKPGETIAHPITVTAEDGTKRIYTIYLTNKRELSLPEESNEVETKENNQIMTTESSGDNTLKTLEIFNEKEKIPFTFDRKKDSFDFEITNPSIKTITIKATLNDQNASFIDEFGPRSVKINDGNNQVQIKVKAQNGDSKSYILRITKLRAKDHDNTLKSLKINDKEIPLVDGVTKYDLVLSKEINKTRIEAVASSAQAKVEYQDILLTDGDNNVVIVVTSEAQEKKEYYVNIIRNDEKKDNLETIEVIGYDLGFSLNKRNYTLKVNDEIDEIEFKVVPDLAYEVISNKHIHNGSIVTIRVDDTNGTHEYKIKILKEGTNLNTILYIVLAISFAAVIIVLVYVIKKRKKKKTKKTLDIELI